MNDQKANIFNHIIIVEDDEGLNRLIEKRLNNLGYDTLTAFTGKEALELIANHQNILLLTDYVLPDMDADQLITEVQKINEKIPFIINTGRGDERLAVEMMKKGALDYVSKDTGFIEILTEVVKQAEKKMEIEKRLARTEKALLNSEKNFRQIVKKSANGIFVRQNGNFVLVNPSLVKSLEYCEDELMSDDFDMMRILHPDSKTKVRDIIKSFLQIEYDNKNFELTALSKSGSTIRFEVSLTKIEWNGMPAILGILTDVTEFYKLKTEMIKAAKNESINILAGGLAHDFNNILSVILGNLILLSTRLEKNQDVSELVSSIEDTIANGTGLTRQLLSFTKDDDLDTDIISMRQLLKRTVRFTISGSKVKAHYDLQKDLAPVRADRHQIVQVITNLVINAKQAMLDGGDLVVTAKNIEVNEDNRINFLKNGKYVKVSLRDTGPGVPEELQEKIFEAFFSTKNTGQGLGLATCLTILKRHDGWVELENHPESGAIFTFYLPSINAKIADQEEVDTKNSFKGKVLIMDDMRDVRVALKYIFDDLGMEAEIANKGEKALEMIQRSAEELEPYDLVIADLTVQGGYGAVKLLEKMKELNILTDVMVYSGYSNKSEIKNPQEHGFVGSFTKPFRIEDLKTKLEKILDK
ncbi:MAG: response regulator [Fidelibacterota bacterium]